jgi:hypothetical protein
MTTDIKAIFRRPEDQLLVFEHVWAVVIARLCSSALRPTTAAGRACPFAG